MNFLKRAKQMGVVLSRTKCLICIDEINWYELWFGRDAFRVDPVKTKRLAECEPPNGGSQELLPSFTVQHSLLV